ncbi:MAG TPA: pyridoxamine 5'-phosphate oxidase family protein [Aggregatilineaceae bacterium]|nr:pyridoxamine 5'-phosphate oxidase family protein [Aggregatilineaceae bacterium]
MAEIPLLPDDMRPVLRDFLTAHSTLAVATVGESDGRPQVAALFFASDDQFNLYWISDADSRHSKNITGWHNVAATIYEQTWNWAGIKGLQIEGEAEVVHDADEHQHALEVYKAKFPFVTDRFAELIESNVVYVLRPRWMRWLDNERRFGYKQEFSLDVKAI